MIRIGVIGYGYWGPNIVRNFCRLPSVSVSWVCDLNPKTFADVGRIYPTIRTTTLTQDVLNDPDTDAVVIATPPSTHALLAKQALKKGKHVLVEKPMTQTVSDSKKLIALARAKKRTLMVDHTYIYTPTIIKLRSIITSGALGRVYYVDCVRTNLGILQKDSNVMYDLAAHDFSIIDYLFGKKPKTIAATGIAQKLLGQETVAYISVTYDSHLFVHMHVSWLSPIKIRQMIFVGTKKMVVYDDIEPSEKLKIYDKGVSFTKDPKQSYQLRVGYRSGTASVPHINIEEGLFGMTQEFVRAIQTGKQPVTDGSMGLRVVQCLAKATESLRSNSKVIRV